MDNIDGSGDEMVPYAGVVNTNIIASYILSYRKIDQAGNTGNTVTRVVNVVDQSRPIVTSMVAISQSSSEEHTPNYELAGLTISVKVGI
jgi:large repetitive protein